MSYPDRSLRAALIAVSITFCGVRIADAQETPHSDPPLASAEAALARCAAAAGQGRFDEARAAAAIAEAGFRGRIGRAPHDVGALVGLARTLGQCRIPGAGLMQAGELSAESIELLRRALAVEPRHWLARYILALNFYRSPAFMNRSEDAARELDVLIAQQGARDDAAEFARTYEYRGMLWSRAGMRDSAVAVWRRGHRLFPADTALRTRLRIPHDAPAVEIDESPAAVPDDTTGAAVPPVHAEMPAERATAIEAVTVTATAVTAAAGATPGERKLRRSDVIMTAGGTADVYQAVQLQPGATRVGEGVDLHTRGGDPAETPSFLNGGRLVPMSRFEGLSGGLFGAIDPWVVRSVRFSSGGFSVRHGNALSGIVDIETDGRPVDAHWRAGLALGHVGVTGRSAIGGSAGAWATLRATHAGALLETHGRAAEFDGAPTSLEGMASFILQPALGHELRLVTLLERDRSARLVDANGYSGPFRTSGTSGAAVLSTQHLAVRHPAIVRGSLSLSSRSTDWEFGILSSDRRERSAIGRTEVEYFPAEVVTVRAGAEGGRLTRAHSGRVPLSGDVAPGAPYRELGDDEAGTWTVGSFMEAEWSLPFARLLAGTRIDRLPGETDITVDPRLSVSARYGAWTGRVSGGVFHQGRWRGESAIPNAGVPSGLPREAVHLVAAIEREGRLPIRVEAFRKDYADYGVHGAGPKIVDGAARGVDVLMQRPTGRVSGWLGYSWLDSEVRLADGAAARSPFDVTHTATASSTLRLARGTTLGSTARYGTGRPFTPIVGSRTVTGSERPEPVHGPVMSQRLPEYARLDARLTQFLPLRRSLLTGYVEVINLLDRRNISGYVWDAAYSTRRATSTFYGQRTFVVGFELQSR